MKRRKSSKEAKSSRYSRSKEKKSLGTSKDASQSQHKSSGKSAHAEEPRHVAPSCSTEADQSFECGITDGMLNDVRSALHDIALEMWMKYLRKRKWSNLDKQRARVMFQDIEKKLFERMIIRNLEKFGGNVSNDGDDYDDDGDNHANDDDKKDDDEEKTNEEKMDEEDDDEATKELYKDVNVNLGNQNTDMTDVVHGGADQQNVSQESGFEQVEEDAHVTLTPILDTLKTDGTMQSSSVSSDFTSKLLNLENPSPYENEIASLMGTTVLPEITSVSTTTILPPHPFFNPLPQQATPTLTPTTYKATTSSPALPDFDFVFKFNERVTNLSEMKQVDQYAKALSSIPIILDTGNNDEQLADKEVSKVDWFKKPERSPTPNPEWNKRQHVDFRPPQTWINQVAHAKEPLSSFDELMNTPIDFSAFVLNRLNIKDLT
ncbi:hypothetical protein Tco_0339809 [Tanacetum coccineum]